MCHDKKEIRKELADICPSLPIDSDEYAHDIEQLSLRYIQDREARELIQEILEDEASSEEAAIMAFYSLCIMDCKQFQMTDFGKRLDSFRDRFKQSPYAQLYHFEKAVYLKQRQRKGDLCAALGLWRGELQTLRYYPAFAQAYAETVAILCENNGGRDCKEAGEVFDDALQAISNACTQRDDYARYKATYGRLLALDGDPDAGIELIRQAIDRQNPNHPLYPLSLIGYQSAILRIEQLRLGDKIQQDINNGKRDIEETRKQIEKARYDNVVVLGVFGTLISVIIGSFGLTRSGGFSTIAPILLLLTGSLTLILTVAFMAIYLPDQERAKGNKGRWVLPLSIGTILIIVAFASAFVMNGAGAAG